VFDQGFRLYARYARESGDGAGIAPGVLYGLKKSPVGPSVRELFACRMQADAARAVALGLAGVTAEQPPPLYAFDPDIGRLAITTPSYSTAVVPVNQGAVPYGGIELARLFDRGQRAVGGVGARPWASFGVLVRNQSARAVLTTERGRVAPDPLRPPLELTRSPRGAVRHAQQYPARPYAGRFDRLVARGFTESLEAAAQTTHRFHSTYIETRWRIFRRKRGRYSVDVLFPSWGRQAQVEAFLRDGQRVVLAGPTVRRRRVHMRNVAFFYLAGSDGGYVVVPRGKRRGRARIVRPKAQASAPTPGPTLVIGLAHRARFKRLELVARIAPAESAAEAAAVAQRLGGRKRRKTAQPPAGA
jgi:hypothetical protein